jgi:hypothetical protein
MSVLYIRMGIETLVVLFKCLESSMHELLYIRTDMQVSRGPL